MRKSFFCTLLFCVIFPFVLQAGTVRLINNSPYTLRAVIRGSDGSYLGEVIVQAQRETVWTDTYSQFGTYGGANGNLNENYRSVTPYTVLWYCMDGGDYAVCDIVATGALVMSQSCMGARMCKAQKKERYPRQPEGNYLHPETPAPTTPPLNQ
jgi:hypothetical protein